MFQKIGGFLKFLKNIPKYIFGNFHSRYIPLLMVYFAYGASGFAGIAETFWVKKELHLSAEALAGIVFWVGIPWTIKMVFGQFADSIRIFGAGRKIYIFIGASLIAAGQMVMIGLSLKSPWLLQFGSPGMLYLLASVIGAIGFVLQDVIADAMSTEVVNRQTGIEIKGKIRTHEDVETELKHVQWLGRVALMMAGIIVAGLGGWLAAIYEYSTIFTLALFIPLVSVTGAMFVKLNPVPRTPINWWVLGGGIAFGAFAISVGFFNIPYCQEIVFAVSLTTVCFLLYRMGMTKLLAYSAITLFLYRAIPGPGPGVSWWMIDVLKFNEAFQGTLSQTGAICGLAGLLIFRKYITEKPIAFTLVWLTIAGTIFSLPTIGMYYGIHTALGLSAKTVAFVDTTIAAPLGQLSMVPMLALIARTCQTGHAGTTFALMASLMNLALSAGALGTRYLNHIWIVTRELKNAAGVVVTHADYGNVGILMIITTTIGLIIPLAAIYFFLRKSFTK